MSNIYDSRKKQFQIIFSLCSLSDFNRLRERIGKARARANAEKSNAENLKTDAAD